MEVDLENWNLIEDCFSTIPTERIRYYYLQINKSPTQQLLLCAIRNNVWSRQVRQRQQLRFQPPRRPIPGFSRIPSIRFPGFKLNFSYPIKNLIWIEKQKQEATNINKVIHSKFTWLVAKNIIKYLWKKEIPESSIEAEYIYLDTHERRRFAQTPHEPIIMQFSNPGMASLCYI